MSINTLGFTSLIYTNIIKTNRSRSYSIATIRSTNSITNYFALISFWI